jgi:DNA-binding transcriptional MerR regulator
MGPETCEAGVAVEPKLGAKLFYKIGEVSKITQLPPYVLRFWESEFSFLQPKKSRGQQRLYVQRDIETILEVKRLLYDEGLTIAGVNRFWTKRGRHRNKPVSPRDVAKRIRGRLEAVLRLLDGDRQ